MNLLNFGRLTINLFNDFSSGICNVNPIVQEFEQGLLLDTTGKASHKQPTSDFLSFLFCKGGYNLNCNIYIEHNNY